VALGALLLAVGPLLWAGSEREVMTVSSAAMVSRNVPTTVTYVSLPGLAMSIRIPAPGSEVKPPYGLIVRDSVADDALTVVMTGDDPLQLRTRAVVGRLQARPYTQAAAAAFALRAETTARLMTAAVLLEITPGADEEVREVDGVGELAEVPVGTLVQVPLRFDGEAAATCTLVAEGCPPRALAGGSGRFVHLAHDVDESGESAAVMVETAAPTSVVPGQWQGAQVRNQDELEDFASSLPVHALAGWGRMLVLTSIQDDPNLVRNRSWLGPVLLATLAVLLWLGGRIGYPYFRPMVGGGRRWEATPSRGAGSAAAEIAAPERPPDIDVRVSGYALTTAGRRRHLDEVRGVIRLAGVGEDGRVTAALDLADSARIALAAHDTGLLGRVERGHVVSLAGVRPALWAHWFGTDLRMTFSTETDRDRAAVLIGSGTR
jgi:hypothetical protein